MRYLIDTDVLIDILRGKHTIEKEVVAAGIGISIINFGELIYGAYKSPDPLKALKIAESFLIDLHISIIPLGKEIMYSFAEMKAKLERSGQRLEDFDLLIAASAKVSGLTLITRNIKHFARIHGLKVKN